MWCEIISGKGREIHHDETVFFPRKFQRAFFWLISCAATLVVGVWRTLAGAGGVGRSMEAAGVSISTSLFVIGSCALDVDLWYGRVVRAISKLSLETVLLLEEATGEQSIEYVSIDLALDRSII